MVIILGTLMYIIEGQQNDFDNIPKSIYWAVVTITTVGYGDVVPITALGKTVAVIIMMLGYAIIAVPTGIVASELTKTKSRERQDKIIEKEDRIIEKEDLILEKMKSLEDKIDKLSKD